MIHAMWRHLVVGFFLTASVLLVTNLYAQEKYTYEYSPPQSSRYVQEHIIDVDDVPGHKLRIVEIQRVYTKDHPVVMGVKVVENWQRAFTNYIGGTGPVQAYETWLLEDGSKIFLEVNALTSSEATSTGSRRGTSHGTSRIVGGTGKFVSIQGMVVTSVEFDTDPKTGYNRPTGHGEYWFAKP